MFTQLTEKERHRKGRGLRRKDMGKGVDYEGKTWERERTEKGRHGKGRGLRREED